MSSRPDASWWARNRRYVALACAATAAGVTAYQLAHPRVKATQAALQRAADTLEKYSTAAALAGDALATLSADIKQFLASDADELPPSLRQLGKLVRSQELQDTLAACIASAVKGTLASGSPAADGEPGEPSVVDKVIEAVLSDRGQSLVGLAVRTAAQTSSDTFCAALRTGIEAAMTTSSSSSSSQHQQPEQHPDASPAASPRHYQQQHSPSRQRHQQQQGLHPAAATLLAVLSNPQESMMTAFMEMLAVPGNKELMIEVMSSVSAAFCREAAAACVAPASTVASPRPASRLAHQALPQPLLQHAPHAAASSSRALKQLQPNYTAAAAAAAGSDSEDVAEDGSGGSQPSTPQSGPGTPEPSSQQSRLLPSACVAWPAAAPLQEVQSQGSSCAATASPAWVRAGAAASEPTAAAAQRCGGVVDPAALGPMSTLLMVDVSRSSTREFVLSLLPASWSLAARDGGGAGSALASAALTAALYRVYSSVCVVLFLMVYALGPKTLGAAVDDISVYTAVSTQSVADAEIKLDKPRVVVLGSGWASACFMKALPKDIKKKYEVVMVSLATISWSCSSSGSGHWQYTPLLPAVAVGTMEERSIVEPVRNLVLGKGDYYEAVCKAIDPARKELVGSVNNTFGVQGVQEYCQFFKSIEDANALRRRISECFERAALPYVGGVLRLSARSGSRQLGLTPEEERKKLLSFVICGGGPTGVEVAAEIHDFVYNDLKGSLGGAAKLQQPPVAAVHVLQAHYPALLKDVRIRVIELMDYVLSTYDRKIGEFTNKQFERAGIELVLNTRVASVRDGYVAVVPKNGEQYEIPFGSCVWATGIAMNPLIKELQQLFPQQTHFRSALTDDYLRVKGSDGSIWAFGDASTIDQPRALQRADDLFEQADTNKDGLVGLKELQALLTEASKEFSHLEEHARFLEAKNKRFGGLLQRALAGSNANGANSPMRTVEETDELTKEQFRALLEKIDSGLRALPATAQVAKQQGEYLAEVLRHGSFDQQAGVLQPSHKQAPFKYNHKGSLAYVGGDKAVMDIPKIGPIFGTEAGILWKGYETFAQISLRNQVLVLNDWVRTKVFGRDISRV
ncbi:hypothetical protein COO60DRAFT_1633095 [Scenedesmus sp. NREL 46B-D3]|nr:hypothetical protein COO60DRAFT_1633095 [Scenedesmus sp. NREL 46B-D3]